MAAGTKTRGRQAPENTPAFGGIAERFRRAGDLDKAIALCREGLKKFPDQVSARVTLGWALLDQQKYDEARAELEAALRRAPDNLAAIRGLAELHDRAESTMMLSMDGPGQWPPDESMIEDAADSAGESAAVAGAPAAVAADAEVQPSFARSGLVSESSFFGGGANYDTSPGIFTRASPARADRLSRATIDIDPPVTASDEPYPEIDHAALHAADDVAAEAVAGAVEEAVAEAVAEAAIEVEPETVIATDAIAAMDPDPVVDAAPTVVASVDALAADVDPAELERLLQEAAALEDATFDPPAAIPISEPDLLPSADSDLADAVAYQAAPDADPVFDTPAIDLATLETASFETASTDGTSADVETLDIATLEVAPLETARRPVAEEEFPAAPSEVIAFDPIQDHAEPSPEHAALAGFATLDFDPPLVSEPLVVSVVDADVADAPEPDRAAVVQPESFELLAAAAADFAPPDVVTERRHSRASDAEAAIDALHVAATFEMPAPDADFAFPEAAHDRRVAAADADPGLVPVVFDVPVPAADFAPPEVQADRRPTRTAADFEPAHPAAAFELPAPPVDFAPPEVTRPVPARAVDLAPTAPLTFEALPAAQDFIPPDFTDDRLRVSTMDADPLPSAFDLELHPARAADFAPPTLAADTDLVAPADDYSADFADLAELPVGAAIPVPDYLHAEALPASASQDGDDGLAVVEMPLASAAHDFVVPEIATLGPDPVSLASAADTTDLLPFATFADDGAERSRAFTFAAAHAADLRGEGAHAADLREDEDAVDAFEIGAAPAALGEVLLFPTHDAHIAADDDDDGQEIEVATDPFAAPSVGAPSATVVAARPATSRRKPPRRGPSRIDRDDDVRAEPPVPTVASAIGAEDLAAPEPFGVAASPAAAALAIEPEGAFDAIVEIAATAATTTDAAAEMGPQVDAGVQSGPTRQVEPEPQVEPEAEFVATLQVEPEPQVEAETVTVSTPVSDAVEELVVAAESARKPETVSEPAGEIDLVAARTAETLDISGVTPLVAPERVQSPPILVAVPPTRAQRLQRMLRRVEGRRLETATASVA